MSIIDDYFNDGTGKLGPVDKTDHRTICSRDIESQRWAIQAKDKIMRLETIVHQAETVRDLQKRYFKSRDYKALEQSKEAEKLLDTLIAEYNSKQEKLL